jgi:ABC-2 type transport system permease protein
MLLIAQVALMTQRNLATTFREPTWILPSVLGVFFLLIYEGSLSGAAEFFLAGQSYLGFIVPLSVISTALSGSSAAGEAIIRDSNSGYFDKLLLTPVSRSALLLGPMIGSSLVLALQVSLVIGITLLLGLRPVTGFPGILVMLGFAMLLAIGLAGLIVGVALRTNSSSATTSASFLVFPLTFLTSTFTPLELLRGWVRIAAEINPITYILEALRGVINVGWDVEALLKALIVLLIVNLISFVFAFSSLRARTARR